MTDYGFGWAMGNAVERLVLRTGQFRLINCPIVWHSHTSASMGICLSQMTLSSRSCDSNKEMVLSRSKSVKEEYIAVHELVVNFLSIYVYVGS